MRIFLRQHRERQWNKDSEEAQAVRNIGRYNSGKSDWNDPTNLFGSYQPWLNHANPAVVANTLICLIHQANYLLDHQINSLERDFIQQGGYSEQLASARVATRQLQKKTVSSEPPPICTICGKPMVIRTARQGSHVGGSILGLFRLPEL